MEPGRLNFVVVSCALVAVLWLSAPIIGNINEPVWTLGQSEPLFDGDHAYTMAREYVLAYPRRVLGSVESRQSTAYLKQQLADLGYDISYTQFDARIRGRTQVGRNVLAYRQGSSPEIVAVIAHYDTAPSTYQGAMEDGSGTGVMLELARVFSKVPVARSLLFIAADGTEFGQLGARDIVESYPDRGHIVAVLSLDHVSLGALGALSLDTVGQFGGFSPPWLREISRMAADMENLPVRSPRDVVEHFQRAVPIPWTDQGPFLHAGIPAINLSSISATDENRAREIYHTAEDTIQNLYAEGVTRYGRVAERIVRTLGDLTRMPVQSMGSFRLYDTSYVSPGTMSFLHWIIFLPFCVLLVFHLVDHRTSFSIAGVERELLAYLCTSLPLLILYYPIGFFRRLRLIPEYPLYPATVRDPVLSNPSWGVVAGILSAGLIVAVALYFVFRHVRRRLPPPDFHVSKTVLMVILLGVIVLALEYNSYWASTFLFLPAWIWGTVGPARRPRWRLIYWLLIIAAGIACYSFVARSASFLYLGWGFIWYGILALSCGLVTPAAYILGAVTVAIGIRFLAIQLHRSQA